MDSALAPGRPTRSSAFAASQSFKLCRPEIARRQLSLRFSNLPERSHSLNASSSSTLLPLTKKIRRRHGSAESHPDRVRVSSGDAQFGSSPEENEVQAPSLAEFITSERVKVAAMLALALALCNADRVVMSVAIVPLSLSHGWSRSFAGIVQVGFTVVCLCFCVLRV